MDDAIEADDGMQVQGGRFAIIPEWVLYHPGLNPTAVRVYGVLSRLSGCGEIRPSRTWIAGKIGVSTDAVSRALRLLQEIGAVVVTPRYGDKGQLANNYRLVSDAPTHYVSSAVTDQVRPLCKNAEGDPLRKNAEGPLRKNAARKKEGEKERNPSTGSAGTVSTDFGADPDAPRREEGKKPKGPSYSTVEHFLNSWQTVVMSRPEYGMFQRVPNKAAAYTWLNQNYFQPKQGDPYSLEYVVGLVDDFMERVRTDQITPSPGFTAWQCFVKNVGRLGSQITVTFDDSEYVVF